jgi:hypothetical protein
MVSSSPTWEQFKLEEARPGVCPCCDCRLPPSRGPRGRIICGDPECQRLADNIYRRGYRARRRATVSEPTRVGEIRLSGDSPFAQLWNRSISKLSRG